MHWRTGVGEEGGRGGVYANGWRMEGGGDELNSVPTREKPRHYQIVRACRGDVEDRNLLVDGQSKLHSPVVGSVVMDVPRQVRVFPLSLMLLMLGVCVLVTVDAVRSGTFVTYLLYTAGTGLLCLFSCFVVLDPSNSPKREREKKTRQRNVSPVLLF